MHLRPAFFFAGLLACAVPLSVHADDETIKEKELVRRTQELFDARLVEERAIRL